MLFAVQVPHIGILTDGLLWVFVRYNEDTGQFVNSQSFGVMLTASSTPSRLREQLHDVVARLVMLLQEHTASVDAMTSARALNLKKQAT